MERWLGGHQSQQRATSPRSGLEQLLQERDQALRSLEEKETQLRRMTATVPGMLFDYILRPDGTDQFLYVSRRSVELLEVEPEELMRDAGVFWRMINPDDLPRISAEVIKANKARGRLQVEFGIVTPSRKQKWLQVRSDPEPEPPRHPDWIWSGVALDATAQKRAEESLREADRRKSEFLAVMSHELRNPLAPIQNSLHILARAAPGSAQAQRARTMIERQFKQLSRLIEDLLEATRLSQDKIELRRQRVDLNELVQQAAEDCRPLLQQREVALELIRDLEPVVVEADPVRIAQIVGNLLENAAKFARPGGTARVTVSTAAHDAQAEIRVADTGIGISAETLPRLFQPFMQADRTLDRSKGGLGLGLMLVKGLTELHGGSVSAHSEGPGKGAEFVVRLPLAATEQANATPAARASGHAGRRRVLVIEDNVDAADSLREALELNDHKVSVAYRGPEGLSKARQEHPEVVLCDIGLPEMNGYEVARAIRGDADLRDTHLIALTGYALPEDRQRSAEAGFERHLAKPLDLDRLEELLESLAS